MNPAHLIKMANQIGDFFAAMPDHGEAVAGIASHIRNSWDPRMIETLQNHLATHGKDGLSAIVDEAISQHLLT